MDRSLDQGAYDRKGERNRHSGYIFEGRDKRSPHRLDGLDTENERKGSRKTQGYWPSQYDSTDVN